MLYKNKNKLWKDQLSNTFIISYFYTTVIAKEIFLCLLVVIKTKVVRVAVCMFIRELTQFSAVSTIHFVSAITVFAHPQNDVNSPLINSFFTTKLYNFIISSESWTVDVGLTLQSWKITLGCVLYRCYSCSWYILT